MRQAEQRVSVRQLREVDPERLAAIVAARTPDALVWLRAAARQGVPRAQAILGQRLLFGEGTTRQPGEALHWLALAAQSDDLDAINLMGRCCEHGWGRVVDAQMATYWYRLAALRGLDWGMYNLANLLMSGQGTAVDRPAALAWYRQAAEAGHAKSINVLGRFHEEGWEGEADLERAFALYGCAARGGDFRGQFNYARMLLERGAMAQALIWLRLIPATATPAFMHNLRGWLLNSSHAAVKALAGEAIFLSGERA
ncbi:tetratricopeptide repeat protein [Herbaspirillum sp. alder98]|uniref:tetratricopeptide repeat protein n=1 Tax=Herbaspirillum sp. alder98 TaxID=2913096 RepID=UPI001CD904F6|nr:tetratricopeptide repeat protein [Herbaspirillum sp. alder98]MCA1325028.1 sel1 repeat family protein [Herbaspirillum sp. alder98]